MGAVWLVFGAEFRRRWRSWLVLAVLIAVVGGLVLAAAAAGRRTATAFPRFVTAHGFDVYVYNNQPVPGLARLPGVASVTTIGNPASGQPTCDCTHAIDAPNFYINEVSPTALSRVVKLVAGRMPIQSSQDEVLASFNLQQDNGVHIGSVIHAPLYASSQVQALASGANASPSGPTVAFHVVGIEAAELEFPSGQAPEYDLFTTQAFATCREPTNSGRRGISRSTEARDRGSSPICRRRQPTPPRLCLEPGHRRRGGRGDRSTPRRWAGGCWPHWPHWRAWRSSGRRLAARVWSRARSTARCRPWVCPGASSSCWARLRNLVVALAGGAGAVVVAYSLSPLTPVGEARLAEPSTGLAFDPLVLCARGVGDRGRGGSPGVWPAVRASRVRIDDEWVPDSYPSSVVARLATTGAPPSAVIGVRHALERGRGAASIPVGTALFGTALAVMALCATAVFGASLSHLTATPALYGSDYQLTFSNVGGGAGNFTSELAGLEHDPAITGIMLAARDEVSINGVSVLAIAGKAVRGPLLMSIVSGRLPTGDRRCRARLHNAGAGR